MTAGDWAAIGVATNESVMQWYSMITQKPLPEQPSIVSTPLPGGGTFSLNNQTILLLGALALLAFVILKD
jgi:hypothetical protein